MWSIIRNVLSVLYLVFLGLLHCSACGHGFSAETLVRLDNELSQTIHAICLHALDNKIVVSSYDVDAFCNVNQCVKLGKRSKSNCYIRLGFDDGFNDTSHDDIVCTPMQEFYLPKTDEWIPAYKLKTGYKLLTKDMTLKSVTYIQFVPELLKIYMLEIENSHTFFVGKYSILTHNIILPLVASLGFTVPFGSVATGTIGSFFGPIGMIGGIVLGGVISIAIKAVYENRISRYKIPIYKVGAFKDHCHNSMHYNEDINSSTNPIGCFTDDGALNKVPIHVMPIEDLLPTSRPGCIEIEVIPLHKVITKGCGKYNEPKINTVQGCFEPITLGDELLCYSQEKSPTKDNPNIRYDGPKYTRTEDWINEHSFGQEIKNSLERSCYINQGKRVLEVIKKIENCDGLKRGDYVVVDALHNDHLEVFDKHKDWSHVANFDGTINHEKTRQGQKEKRQPLRKG